ncbi:MAG: ACT domain-containing protein [Candidatus Peribacteraceae bacterium]|nr:ACT domain-containing protein [Candidatus Peribacteraceae bacterium]
MSALTMTVASQINVTVENIPGQLAKVARLLADAGISINGLSCTEIGSKATWHFVVSDVNAAKTVLAKAGHQSAIEEILEFICPSDRPGVIADIAESCAKAGVNIGSIYTASTGLEQPAVVYMWVDKAHFAKAKAACVRIM